MTEAFKLGIDPMPDWFMDRVSDNRVILHKGDPGGADVIDDLATAISAMLKWPTQPSMWAYSVSDARGYPVWETWEENSQEPPDEQCQITLMASAFPIGTRIQVLEPNERK